MQSGQQKREASSLLAPHEPVTNHNQTFAAKHEQKNYHNIEKIDH
jgi:hypothetical protein